MDKKFLSAIILVICLMISGCGEELSANESEVTWGRADAKEIDVNSKIAGRVVELLVKEGDKVEKDSLIARIDQRDLLAQKTKIEANIAAIQAQQLQAAALTEMQRNTLNSALDQAKSAKEKARADLELCRADYNRYSELVKNGAVSQKIFEEYRTKFDVAEANFNQADVAVNQAQAALMQTQVNIANEQALEKTLEQARAGLNQLEISLDETEIRAPFDGIITAKYVEAGSMISQGTPLVSVQDPFDNWVDLKVPETQLKNFAVNQKLELVARDGTTKVIGVVTDISKKSEFATQRATSERGDESDIISFNVKIQLNADFVRPGMRFRLNA